MRTNMFIGIDLQRDFMNRDGALYVLGSEEIKPKIKELINFIVKDKENLLAYTRDIHLPTDEELSDTPDYINTFPPHCMKSTPGANIIPEGFGVDNMTEVMSGCCDITSFVKNKFSVFEASNEFLGFMAANSPITNIYVFGVAGNFCVKGVIDGLIQYRDKEIKFDNLFIIKDCIASTNNEEFEQYLTEKILEFEYIKIIQSNDLYK